MHELYRNEYHDNYLAQHIHILQQIQYGGCFYFEFKENFVFYILGCNSCGYGATFHQWKIFLFDLKINELY